jgi:nicotinamide-nucleotide amidase
MSRPIETAEIIAVGSEMLTMSRIDTNSLFLADHLAANGIVLRQKHVVGDHAADLRAAISDALARVDLVITTGGLGPTDDDLTREAVAAVLGRPLEPVEEVLATIRRRFDQRGVRMPLVNRRQAEVIAGARWLRNANGTAPGQIVDVGGQLIVLLPGPPRELRPMFERDVLPLLIERSQGRRVSRRVLRTTGRSESQVEEVAQPIYSRFTQLDPPIDTTILASPGLVELQLSAADKDVEKLERLLDDAADQLAAALGDAVFTRDRRSIEEVVGAELERRQLTIAAAESCTGGLFLQRLTAVPGSSAWVLGGTVAYHNGVKVRELGVAPADLEQHGAVSEVVARAMAEGVRARYGASVGVGITGIAGPAGGSDEKPVGTVWIAVAAGETTASRFLFPGDREMVRQFSAAAAFNMVRQTIARPDHPHDS